MSMPSYALVLGTMQLTATLPQLAPPTVHVPTLRAPATEVLSAGTPVLSSAAAHPTSAAVLRHITLPEYNGKGSVEGWIHTC